ncbi:MAG TPA: ankyrin repeat domain-containing protein [Burkholderiales bacterium]|nr:ankyrin repeat domain-containing protein [Burkholderiales bacterium]
MITGCASTAPSGPLDLQRVSSAVLLDDVRYVRSLVEANLITVNQLIPGIGYAVTPMITVAARNGSVSVLRYLIEARADLNARTPDRDTALMLAALFGQEDRERNSISYMRYDQAVRLLVDAGASLENADLNAYTPLAYAAYAGRDYTVSYLLEKGAKVNASAQGRTSYINTPLMMASLQGHRNTALHLLRAGADASVRMQDGMTAMEYALKNKHTHLEKVLRCAESLHPGETFRQRCE